jgi:4-amino-4-deoxy-L-arabinose transferase-like glycosyltransferase
MATRISTETLSWIKKHPYRLLLAILALALLLRILALLGLKGGIYYDYLLWDERLYHLWATHIASGTFKSTSSFEFPPFPAYLFAIIYKIFEPNASYIRILNLALGVLTCYFMFLVGKEMSDQRAGLLSALIAALYQPFIFYSIVPLKTSLAVFLFAACSYLFLISLRKPSLLYCFLLGIGSGFLINTRPNYLAVVPFLFLVILWKTRSSIRGLFKYPLLFFAGSLLAVSPFTIKNYLSTGRVTFLVSELGYNLYIGNNPGNPSPYYRPVPFAEPSPFVQGIQFQIEASRRAGMKLSSEESSAYWTREVVHIALAEPASFAAKLAQKTLAVFNQFEAGDHYHIGFLSDYVRFFKWPFLTFCLIVPLGIAGMASNFRGSAALKALTVVFALYSLSLVLTYTSTRIRLPLLTILIPFSALGVLQFISWCKERNLKRIFAYTIAVCLFAIIQFIPLSGTGELSAYYNTHAIILESRGSSNEAVGYWEKSGEMNQIYSVFADLSLASKYYN